VAYLDPEPDFGIRNLDVPEDGCPGLTGDGGEVPEWEQAIPYEPPAMLMLSRSTAPAPKSKTPAAAAVASMLTSFNEAGPRPRTSTAAVCPLTSTAIPESTPPPPSKTSAGRSLDTIDTFVPAKVASAPTTRVPSNSQSAASTCSPRESRRLKVSRSHGVGGVSVHAMKTSETTKHQARPRKGISHRRVRRTHPVSGARSGPGSSLARVPNRRVDRTCSGCTAHRARRHHPGRSGRCFAAGRRCRS
jgi:hypothetical protein